MRRSVKPLETRPRIKYSVGLPNWTVYKHGLKGGLVQGTTASSPDEALRFVLAREGYRHLYEDFRNDMYSDHPSVRVKALEELDLPKVID